MLKRAALPGYALPGLFRHGQYGRRVNQISRSGPQRPAAAAAQQRRFTAALGREAFWFGWFADAGLQCLRGERGHGRLALLWQTFLQAQQSFLPLPDHARADDGEARRVAGVLQQSSKPCR